MDTVIYGWMALFRLGQILCALIIAASAAAAVQVGFVRLLGGAIETYDLLKLMGPTTALTFAFGAPMSLPFIIFEEIKPRFGFFYFVFAGLVVSLAGLLVLIAGESGGPSILNSWAILGLCLSGLVGGATYWAIADRAS